MSRGKMDDLHQWYELYGDELYRTLCIAVKNSDMAGDICQESFLKMAAYLSKKNQTLKIENPRAFLYKIAYNEIYSRHKKKKLEQHLSFVFGSQIAQVKTDITPEEILINKQELIMTQEVIKNLPHKQREIFLLSRENNFSHKEIANRLNLKKNNVKQHIIRALHKVRSAASKRGEKHD